MFANAFWLQEIGWISITIVVRNSMGLSIRIAVYIIIGFGDSFCNESPLYYSSMTPIKGTVSLAILIQRGTMIFIGRK